MSARISFWLLAAFSTEADGGNPAAVVFMDLNRPIDVYQKIAENFNQPITTFLCLSSSSPADKKKLSLNVRWFTPDQSEIELCGHGTLAASRAVFETDMATEETEVLEFHTLSHGTMTAWRREGGLFELQLPSVDGIGVSREEQSRLQTILARSCGREVAINYIARGGKGFEHYLMVELDEQENLKGLRVDADALRDSGFSINIITAASSTGNEQYVTRMFAPGRVPGDEDHVCGSSHCLTAPYWYKKLGISRGQEVSANHVSPRGGNVKVLWEEGRDIVRLKGAMTILGRGELQIF